MHSFGKLEQTHTKFTLHRINMSAIDKQYMTDIQELGIEHTSKSIQETGAAAMTKLGGSNRLETKNNSKSFDTILMNESVVRVFVSPLGTSSACWHCRHFLPQEWQPLGLPLLYKKTEETFDCEGVFCSFNCMAAFLADSHCYRYNNSSVLMLMMYRKLFKCSYNFKIVPAPSWKLLKTYGGHLSIEEFQKSFQHVEYKSLHQTVRTDSIRIQQVAEMFIETFVKN
jgi:hypothetical protein